MDTTRLLEGQVAVVTGGAGVLGRTYCEALAGAGARIVVVDRDERGVMDYVAELEPNGVEALGVAADVADDDAVASMVRRTCDRFGGIDILVNNAGLLRDQYNLCSELSSEEWRNIFSVNVVGAVICARACRPSMVERGGGIIVNQSSMGAYAALTSAYSVSKLALSGLTVALAAEFGADGIRVNGIAPGMMTGKLPPELVESLLSQQVIPRRGEANDLVGALLFLCADASSFMSGQTLIVDGGVTHRP